MDVHLCGPAAVPGGEQDAAAAALVRDVLHAVHDVGDASKAAEAAEAEGPGATINRISKSSSRVGHASRRDLLCGVSRLERAVGHAALPARRTVRRRGPAAQTGDGRRVLVDGAGGLLGGHAGRGAEGLLLVFVRVSVVRARRLGLLLRVRLLVLLLLLLVLRLRGLVLRVVLRRRGVLVHRRLLRGACDVGRLGVLLHGDWEGQYGRVVRRVEGLGCAARGYRLCDMLLVCRGF